MENNRIVKCHKCHIPQHEICGGSTECDACRYQMVHNIQVRRVCQLCGLTYPGIPLKFIGLQFYHLACAFHSNLLKVEQGKLKTTEYLEPTDP
jgi:hypothetical protein